MEVAFALLAIAAILGWVVTTYLLNRTIVYLHDTYLAEKRGLLNRIMAKDYSSYVAGELQTKPFPERSQLLTDAQEAEYARRQRGE